MSVAKKRRVDAAAVLGETADCPVCFRDPIIGRIMMCPNSHGMCEDCFHALPAPSKCTICTTVFATPPMRNFALEQIVARLELPCPLDCGLVATGDALQEHMKNCPSKACACPVWNCSVKVAPKKIAEHLKFNHKVKFANRKDLSQMSLTELRAKATAAKVIATGDKASILPRVQQTEPYVFRTSNVLGDNFFQGSCYASVDAVCWDCQDDGVSVWVKGLKGTLGPNPIECYYVRIFHYVQQREFTATFGKGDSRAVYSGTTEPIQDCKEGAENTACGQGQLPAFDDLKGFFITKKAAANISKQFMVDGNFGFEVKFI